jgi:subtilisin-like proprotein convertase family protein
VIAGESVTTDAPHFTIEIDPTVACGTTLSFDVTFAGAEGGPFAASFEHEVGTVEVLSGPGGAIPNYDPNGLTSSLFVGQDLTLTDLGVRVMIDHGYVGDLRIELESPGGTRITLLDRPGQPATWFGCEDDDMDVTFDDSSTYDLENHCAGTDPWYSGVAAPTEPLAAFTGESTAGTWKLIVSDHLTGNAGTLLGWDFLPTPAVGGTCNVCGTTTTDAPAIAEATPFGLAPARPNPFAELAELAFTLDRPGRASLEIFDVSGRRVRTIVDRDLGAGRHSFSWNGRDTGGRDVSSGIYFVRRGSGGALNSPGGSVPGCGPTTAASRRPTTSTDRSRHGRRSLRRPRRGGSRSRSRSRRRFPTSSLRRRS